MTDIAALIERAINLINSAFGEYACGLAEHAPKHEREKFERNFAAPARKFINDATDALSRLTTPPPPDEIAGLIAQLDMIEIDDPQYASVPENAATALRALALEIERLNSEEPGTPLGRLAGIARFAQERGLCTGVEAKPAELFVLERIRELEAERNAAEEERDTMREDRDAWKDRCERAISDRDRARITHDIIAKERDDFALRLDARRRDCIAIRAKTIEECAKWLEDMPEHWRTLAADMRRALAHSEPVDVSRS